MDPRADPQAPFGKPHPDRLAKTLAARTLLTDAEREGPFATPGPGSADVRVDLKLLQHRVEEALAKPGSAAARDRLRGLDSEDLRAGTIQDGTARGYMVALEEALSLCPEPVAQILTPTAGTTATTRVLNAKELRRHKDLLVASAGARIRFSRRTGVHYIDRDRDINAEHCIQFEDRTDVGTLDCFEPKEGERPRLFDAAHLKPLSYESGPAGDCLVLSGSLGRGRTGVPCRLTFTGTRDKPHLEVLVQIVNHRTDHRLRIRFVGMGTPPPVRGLGTPPAELILVRGRSFTAVTLVRACGRLLVGREVVQVPAAQCLCTVEHHFLLGVDT